MVVVAQVPGEEGHSGEVQLARRDHGEDDGEAPGGARRIDALVSRALGEVEDLDAVGEERGGRAPEVQLPAVDLGEVRQQLRCPLALLAHEAREAAHEIIIRQVLQLVGRHGLLRRALFG